MRKLLFSSTILLAACFAGRTQSILPFITNTGGGSYSDPNAYIKYFEWSIGELSLINTVASADSSVVVYQGLLQPCTDKVGNTAISSGFQPGDFKLFPNPTLGRFEIDFFVHGNGTMTLELTDALGRSMEKRSFKYNGCCRIEQYDLTNLPAGIYMVVATLIPDPVTSINEVPIIRRSGLKVIKVK